MRDLLYKELLDKGLVPINDLSGNPESVVVYLRNKTTGNIRGQITTPGLPANKDLSKPKDPDTGATYVLANQNPSLKIYPRGQVLTENQAAFCLSKGLITSEGEFFELDAVAHEAALNFITNSNNRLHQSDYELTITNSGAKFKFGSGITGTKYTVLGLRGLNYQLIDMNSRIDDTSIMLRHNTTLSWTLLQLKNLLVYQENGEAVLPVFVKWNITGPEDADVIPAVGNEISNGLRMAVAGDKVVYGLDWDGYNKDITYREGEVTLTLLKDSLIAATYDGFYQTMTVTGESGLAVNTKDPNGNVIGSGVIDSNGTVTYPINEGMLLGGTVIATSAQGSNVVEHSLVASFYLASDVFGQNVEFLVSRDLYLGWMNGSEGFNENLAANAVGEMIVEYSSGEQYVVNIADYAGTNGFIVDEFGLGEFDKSVNPAKTGLVSAKVRFRNLNDQIYLWVAQATHIYKFFDDGVSNIGYGLTERDSRPYVQLKQIPSVLPASVRNLNCMFWSDTPVSSDNLSLDGDYLFASADVEANLANWDVSNVESMVDTFAYAKYHSLPIGNWTPTKLKYLVDTFAYAFTDTSINWNTPALINTKFAFEGSGFSGSLYLDMSNVTNADCMFIDNTVFSQDLSLWCVPLLTSAPEDFSRDSILTPGQLPIWGTCPNPL